MPRECGPFSGYACADILAFGDGSGGSLFGARQANHRRRRLRWMAGEGAGGSGWFTLSPFHRVVSCRCCSPWLSALTQRCSLPPNGRIHGMDDIYFSLGCVIPPLVASEKTCSSFTNLALYCSSMTGTTSALSALRWMHCMDKVASWEWSSTLITQH